MKKYLTIIAISLLLSAVTGCTKRADCAQVSGGHNGETPYSSGGDKGDCP